MICVCILLGGGVLFYTKYAAKGKGGSGGKANDPAAVAANEFVNVKDVRGKFLYTRDGLVLAYLKILPISIDLFSKNEKKQIVRQLTANMSSVQYPFQLLAVSRPVDISPLLSEPVSYTHLDVYKRQMPDCARGIRAATVCPAPIGIAM